MTTQKTHSPSTPLPDKARGHVTEQGNVQSITRRKALWLLFWGWLATWLVSCDDAGAKWPFQKPWLLTPAGIDDFQKEVVRIAWIPMTKPRWDKHGTPVGGTGAFFQNTYYYVGDTAEKNNSSWNLSYDIDTGTTPSTTIHVSIQVYDDSRDGSVDQAIEFNFTADDVGRPTHPPSNASTTGIGNNLLGKHKIVRIWQNVYHEYNDNNSRKKLSPQEFLNLMRTLNFK